MGNPDRYENKFNLVGMLGFISYLICAFGLYLENFQFAAIALGIGVILRMLRRLDILHRGN